MAPPPTSFMAMYLGSALALGSLIACGGGTEGGPPSPASNAPVFAIQPADQSQALGTAATFTASASGTPAGFAALIATEAARIRAAGSSVSLGAGVGTWESNGAAFLTALAGTGIDFFDLHIYPVNLGFVDRLTQLTDLAQSLGKPVAISEAWLSKERDSEFTQYDSATDQTIFSRDCFSFWAPLDQGFLGALVKFAHWKHLLYLSPFWTGYFHSYLDYASAQGKTPAEITALAQQAASAALQAGTESSTGVFYANAIR